MRTLYLLRFTNNTILLYPLFFFFLFYLNFIQQTFHIHSVPFLVTSEHGIELDTPFWRDTYPVLDNITATVCFPPTDVGYMVNVHCHMPAHQDAGMFGMYKVLPSTNTVEGEDDTAGADDDDDADDDDVNEEKGSSDNEDADDAGIDEAQESSATTTATNENTPTILLFVPLVLSFSFYFL